MGGRRQREQTIRSSGELNQPLGSVRRGPVPHPHPTPVVSDHPGLPSASPGPLARVFLLGSSVEDRVRGSKLSFITKPFLITHKSPNPLIHRWINPFERAEP